MTRSPGLPSSVRKEAARERRSVRLAGVLAPEGRAKNARQTSRHKTRIAGCGGQPTLKRMRIQSSGASFIFCVNR